MNINLIRFRCVIRYHLFLHHASLQFSIHSISIHNIERKPLINETINKVNIDNILI